MWLYFLILFVIVLVIFIYQASLFIKFEIDGSIYQIKQNSPNRIESLNTLVKIRKQLEQLIHHLTKKYPNDPLVIRVKKRFQHTVLREAVPEGDTSQTSYTINKGDTIVLCLRTVEGNLVDLNTLTYVAVHELSHIYSSSYHHSTEFWNNLRMLMDEATSINIYKPTDYINNPVHYCGIVIASNIPGINPKTNNNPTTTISTTNNNTPNQTGGHTMSTASYIMSRSHVKLSNIKALQ